MNRVKLRCSLDSRVGTNKPEPPSSQWQPEPCPVGVDEKAGKAGVIRGYVACQAGPFKSEGRGRFSEDSLREVIRLWPAEGLGCHS